jgi:hypothetical protein
VNIGAPMSPPPIGNTDETLFAKNIQIMFGPPSLFANNIQIMFGPPLLLAQGTSVRH